MTDTTSLEPAAQPDHGAVVRRLLANGVALLFAWLLPRLATAISVLVAARILGASAFGVWGTAAAYAVIMSIVATLGMQPLLVRELARTPARTGALLAAADRVKAGAIVVMMLLLFGLSAPLGHGAEVTRAALVLGVAYAIGSFVENRAARVQAEERMAIWARASALNGLVAGASGMALVTLTGSVVWYCTAAVLGQLAALAWLHSRAPAPPASAEPGDVRRLLAALAPFTLAFIALTLHAKIAVLLLARWRPALDVGAYVAAYKFLDIAQALILVVVAPVYPRLSRALDAGGGKAAEHRAGRGPAWPWTRPVRAGNVDTGGTPAAGAARLSELLVLTLTPAAAVLWLVREPVVTLLLGGEYAASIAVLSLLAPALPMLAVNVSGAWILAAAGRMQAVAMLYAGAVALDVMLCALWVPVDGATGAARALLVSEWSLGCAMFLVMHVGARLRLGAIPLASAAVVALLTGAVTLVPDATGGVLRAALVLAVAAVVYTRFEVVPAAERALLRAALRRTPP